MVTLLLAFTTLVYLVEMYFLAKAFRYAAGERRRKRAPYAPKVAVIAPHYGWNAQTAANARRLLHLDYPGEYEVLFVTHEVGRGGRDISYRHLDRLAGRSKRARVILAPNVVDRGLQRSQKAENLLAAINRASSDTVVYAFVDADAGIDEGWLRRLVAPLQDEGVGVTTGARLYAPLVPSLASYTEAVWVNYQIALYGESHIGMVWGGSAAIVRETFERARIGRRWLRATFEDQHLTKAMQAAGLRIHFVPDCVPVNYTGDRRWKEVLEFTNRQMAVTYWMKLRLSWWLSLTMLLPKGLIFALTPALFLIDPGRFWPLLAIPVLEGFGYLLFARALPAPIRKDRTVARAILASASAAPAAMFLGGINGVCAFFQRSIVWGGVRYAHRTGEGCVMLGRVRGARERRKSRIRSGLLGIRQGLARLLGVGDEMLDELREGEE